MPHRTNWAGNIDFGDVPCHQPASLAELRALLAAVGRPGSVTSGQGRLRVLGTGHSFSPVAATEGEQVSLAAMPRTAELDSARGLVRVSAGQRYGDVGAWLHARGWALHNLGSLPHISVGGACATGTHGSGDRNGALATAVRAVQVVTVGGDVVELSADGDGPGCGADFAGAVVALGGLGAVTELTLAIEPTYLVAQTVYDGLPFDAVLDRLDAILAAAYSVSLFVPWTDDTVDVWLKQRLGPDGGAADSVVPPALSGIHPAAGARHPLRGEPTDHTTEQGGRPGPWHTRLPHFRLEHTPSAGAELQSEYLVPRERAVEGLRAVHELQEDVARVVLVGEIRSIAADDLWLSGAYGRDTVAIHFTWMPDTAAVLPVAARVEERLLPFGGRPHWGKVFVAPPDAVRPLYPRLDDARRLLSTFDPAGRLSNAFLDAYLRD
jgi:xylitol oxidase